MATKLEKHRWLNTGTNGSGTPCSGARLQSCRWVGGWVWGVGGMGCGWYGVWVCMGVCEGVGGCRRKWRVNSFPHSLSLVPRPSHPSVGHLQFCKRQTLGRRPGNKATLVSPAAKFQDSHCCAC